MCPNLSPICPHYIRHLCLAASLWEGIVHLYRPLVMKVEVEISATALDISHIYLEPLKMSIKSLLLFS